MSTGEEAPSDNDISLETVFDGLVVFFHGSNAKLQQIFIESHKKCFDFP